jgi:hypothetical protein
MRLEETIVIFRRNRPDTQAIDLVLIVKHPEGCDPVERLYACIHDFIQREADKSAQTPNREFTWSGLIQSMQGWDWSSQTLHIEEVPMWTVIDRDADLLLNANQAA